MGNDKSVQSYTAFTGHTLLAQGPLDDVVLRVKKALKADANASVLVFSDSTGKQMDFDLRGTDKEVLQRLHIYRAPEAPVSSPGPGRPKLGVVAREVSLLPRHWEWLSTQTGGASATLRRLIEDERKKSSSKELVRQAQERTHKVLSAIAGNLPRFEEALRALYAKDKKKFGEQTSQWPRDVRDYAKQLAAEGFE